jgi:hypothetical protein
MTAPLRQTTSGPTIAKEGEIENEKPTFLG